MAVAIREGVARGVGNADRGGRHVPRGGVRRLLRSPRHGEAVDASETLGGQGVAGVVGFRDVQGLSGAVVGVGVHVAIERVGHREIAAAGVRNCHRRVIGWRGLAVAVGKGVAGGVGDADSGGGSAPGGGAGRLLGRPRHGEAIDAGEALGGQRVAVVVVLGDVQGLGGAVVSVGVHVTGDGVGDREITVAGVRDRHRVGVGGRGIAVGVGEGVA